MKRKIFPVFSLLFLLVWVIFLAFPQQKPHTVYANDFSLSGSIFVPDLWNGGHIGNVKFLPDFTQHKPHFNENGILKWFFWIGSVGWVTFNYGNAKINCPEGALTGSVNNENIICPITGNAWSQNAGWIVLGKNEIGTWTGVYFNPNRSNLEGFGWSRSIGWVPIVTGGIYTASGTQSNWWKWNIPFTDGEFKKTNNNTTGVSLNFYGNVAVIGNLAGTKIHSVINQHLSTLNTVGLSYDTILHASILNQVRGRIAQITRNIDTSRSTTNPLNGVLYNEEKDYCINTNQSCGYDATSIPANTENSQEKTIIVRGKDIVINSDFNAPTNEDTPPNADHMKAIIALKDANGNGGNIYITNNVSKIYAYIVAEWSIFSGEKSDANTATYYIDTWTNGNKVFSLPQKQLYINGILISKNTIGTVTQKNLTSISKCPVLTICTDADILHYDLWYFRSWWGPTSLPNFRNNNLPPEIQNATVVIDYNSNILFNPPPGLEGLK